MIPLPIHYSEVERIVSDTFGRGVKSLALLSPKANSGLSTVAYAVARRSAVSGRETLLLDLNLAAPVLHRRLALPRTPWKVTEVRTDGRPQRLGSTPLSVLTAPSGELDYSFRDPEKLEAMMRGLEEDYDAIVIDTSALLAVNRGNVPTPLIARAANAALLNVLSGRVSEGDLREAVALCKEGGVTLIGAVYNDREDPRLADELCREARRMKRFLPKVSAWLERQIGQSAFLNQTL